MSGKYTYRYARSESFITTKNEINIQFNVYVSVTRQLPVENNFQKEQSKFMEAGLVYA